MVVTMETNSISSPAKELNESNKSAIPAVRKYLARIRCFQDCVKSYQNYEPFPEVLCYVPSEVEYTACSKSTWKLLGSPNKGAKIVKEVAATPSSKLIGSGEDVTNSFGKWLKVKKVKLTAKDTFEDVPGGIAWLLVTPKDTDDLRAAVSMVNEYLPKLNKDNGKRQKVKINNWEAYLEESYSLLLKKDKSEIVPPDEEAVAKLRCVEDGWNATHDAALVRLLSQDNGNVGCLRNHVDHLQVSSFAEGMGEAMHLTDGDPSTFWETDGDLDQHWIKLQMKKGTIIKYLALTVDKSDDNYLPDQMVVMGGELQSLRLLSNVSVNWNTRLQTEIKLLENCTEHHPVISIRIKSCRSDGIDTRVRGIKLKCQEKDLSYDLIFLSSKNLIRFPSLQSFSQNVMYQRAMVLQRFISLFDSVIQYVISNWQHSIANRQPVKGSSFPRLEIIRQLLPLSGKRQLVINTLLSSTSEEQGNCKEVYINRHDALQHGENSTISPNYSKTVFMQLYEALRQRDRSSNPPTYRWPILTKQWWWCKFIEEHMIDFQGGGFRDSLSNMADELCPPCPDAPMVLPFFIRAPNQLQSDGNINKDVYVPNPNCTEFAKYEWLGQLIGASFRGLEILTLSLAPFVWKKLCGEHYSWSEDFSTVDAAEVALIDNLSKMDKETFEASGRCWSLVLSDDSHVSLKLDTKGDPLPLAYNDREEYAHKVREIRMAEFDKQIKAIKNGLLQVVPEAALHLITWQELEKNICGEPDITVERLMQNTYYYNQEEDSENIRLFWAAVKNFSNTDRSRLLQFITGRRRLPVSFFLSSTGKSHPSDVLPMSITCTNTLYFPLYPDAKTAEEKLRYAAYNCVSIDRDH